MITIEQAKETPKQKVQKQWHIKDAGLILPEYLVEFEYVTKEKKGENTVTLDAKMVKTKEINRVFSATVEAQKILQNTYLNPQVKDGVKGTSFHISSDDLDR